MGSGVWWSFLRRPEKPPEVLSIGWGLGHEPGPFTTTYHLPAEGGARDAEG